MKGFKSVKLVAVISIVLLILQIISPVVVAEQQTTDSTKVISGQKEVQTLESLDKSKELIESTSVETESTTSESQKKESAETSENSLETAKPAKLEAQANTPEPNDLSDKVTVSDWWIFENSVGDPLSATTAASVQVDYNFRFVWSLKKEDGQMVNPGEFFCIDIPENVGIVSENTEGWGFWVISTTETNKTPLEATINGTVYTIGEWWIDWRDDGSPLGKYYIKVVFNEGVLEANANKIDGVQFDVPQKSLKNMTLKGGIQEVVFGNVKKRIKFEQAEGNISEGDDYKYSSKAGSNTITFDVGIGRLTLNELSGDVIDYAANSEKGLYLDGDYHGYRWGENLTELDDIYIEDTLDPGVVVSSLSLSALVQAPIGLSEENRESQTGGLINRDVAAFESYLFADYGNGPVYRTAGSNQEIEFPKQENSYRLLVQENGETLANFRARVKAQPHQYGIFTAGSGKTAQRTLCINIGDIHKEDGIQKKYSDLTDQKYASPERTIIRKNGDDSEERTSVKITQFAVEAANNTIKHGLYPESDRELLEDYYTLAYGDGNVIDGQTSAFNISMTLNYPIDTTLSETKSNTALAHYENAKQKQDPNFEQPGELTGEGTMTSPYGRIVINPDTIALVKYDGTTLTEMNGVEFELQKQGSDRAWTKISTHETAEFTTADGEKIQGVIQVSGLSNGKYRFVEKAGENNVYPEGYDQTESSNWQASENRIVSEELEVDGETTNTPVIVENIPQASAPYAIEHYFLKDGRSPDSTDQADYELNFVENETGEIRKPVGSTFTGTPRSNLLGYSYKKIDSLELASGTITAIMDPNLSYKENGQLVLRFYYVPDDDSVPFTITKLDGADNPMPSYNAQGNPLDKEVSFYIYEFDWGHGKGPNDQGAEPVKGESNDYWKLVETDNQGNLLEQPIKTDSQGRLRAKIDLTTNGVIGDAKTFAIVEATNTYPNYEAPSVETSWWFIWTGTGESNSSPKGTFSWCNNMGAANPGCENDRQADGSVAVSLRNKATKGHMKVYKADQEKKMMPSDAKKQVKFEFYEFINENNWGSGRTPRDGSLDDATLWKPLGTVQTDNEGKLLDYDLTARNTYALKEVQSYPSFVVPTGYWILWTDIVSEGIINHEVEYAQGSNDNPGALQPGAEDNPVGSTVLLNNEIRQEFSFIKENEQAEPLGEVEFELYAGKDDGELEIGVNDDPSAANTYWDMTKPFKTAISSAAGANKGKVSFDLTAGEYLLVETKTVVGYQLPAGQWILTIDPLNTDPDQRILIQARGDPLPPAFYEKEGIYHLPNIRKYKLPSSGAGGLLISVVLGIILIGLAILVSVSGKEKIG